MRTPSDTSPATQSPSPEADAEARQALYQSASALLSRPLSEPPSSPAAGLLFLTELRPRKEDYARVFAADYVEQARKVYEALYLNPRPIERAPHQTVLRLFIASAAELREQGPHALGFPGGYAEILDLLRPDSVWVHWKYAAPHSSSGIAYDGLTRIDDRWVLFPKPYRFLRRAAPDATAAADGEPATPEPAPAPSASSAEAEPAEAATLWKE